MSYKLLNHFYIPENMSYAVDTCDVSGLTDIQAQQVKNFLSSLPQTKLLFDWVESPFQSDENSINADTGIHVVQLDLYTC